MATRRCCPTGWVMLLSHHIFSPAVEFFDSGFNNLGCHSSQAKTALLNINCCNLCGSGAFFFVIFVVYCARGKSYVLHRPRHGKPAAGAFYFLFSFWGDVWGDCILGSSYRRSLVHNDDPLTDQGTHQRVICME